MHLAPRVHLAGGRSRSRGNVGKVVTANSPSSRPKVGVDQSRTGETVRLKRLLPWIAYTYFLGPLDKTNNANWATKHWNGQHRLLLVPQLLRFALFSKRPRPYCELKHSVHNALQLACEPQR